MAKFRSVYFLFLAALIATNNWCVIGSIAIYSDGPKKVCLIGDNHNASFMPNAPCAHDEARDADHLLALAQSAANGPEPVIFCLEESDHHHLLMNRRIIAQPYLQRNELQILTNFAQSQNRKIGNAHFIFADNRSRGFCFWADYMATWSCNFESIIPIFLLNALRKLPETARHVAFPAAYTPENVDSLLRNNPDLLEIFFSPSGLFNRRFYKERQMELFGHIYTVGEFLGKINNFIAVTTQYLKTLDLDDPLFQFIKSNIMLIQKAVQDAYAFFMESSGNDPQMLDRSVADCIHDAIVNKLFSSLREEFIKWGENLTRTTDIAFARTIEKELSQNNIIIFIGGSCHSQALQSFLDLKQFEKIYDRPITVWMKDGYFVSPWPDEVMKEYFTEIKNKLGFK